MLESAGAIPEPALRVASSSRSARVAIRSHRTERDRARHFLTVRADVLHRACRRPGQESRTGTRVPRSRSSTVDATNGSHGSPEPHAEERRAAVAPPVDAADGDLHDESSETLIRESRRCCRRRARCTGTSVRVAPTFRASTMVVSRRRADKPACRSADAERAPVRERNCSALASWRARDRRRAAAAARER